MHPSSTGWLRCLAISAGIAVCHSFSVVAADADGIVADIVLKGGAIHDGTGKPGVVGDLAIKGGRIVAVGQFAVKSVGREIDCRGLVVAPGFIDLHNHSDSQVVDRLTRANVNFLTQGCTTVVTGNCGSGPIKVAEFYDKIDAAGAGTNVAHLLPQGSLRREVIGEAQRPATAGELDKMKSLARQAMQDGAWGMSTGLIYVPSSYADTAELIEIAKVVAETRGLYASHIRSEGVRLLTAVDEALRIGREAGMPVHISHFKSSGQDAWGLVKRAADAIEAARKAGERVTADQYPYIASSTSLDATVIPTWARAGGQKALVARFDDPEQAARLRTAIESDLQKTDDGQRIRIARHAPRPDWAGKNLREIADAEKITTLALVERITRAGGAQIVNFGMSEEDVRFVMALPWVATASDGRAFLPNADRPHPRSYGTFPRKVGAYSVREQVVSLEHAIRSSTGLPADILGLTDRGYLRPETFADVVVFDPREFIDTATFDDPHQYARGVKLVLVNGEPAIERGVPTGSLNGRALRRTVKPST
jgi:N-acyl-D-aspartate/D-glutamate deacylase